jgi:hypothetical protein
MVGHSEKAGRLRGSVPISLVAGEANLNEKPATLTFAASNAASHFLARYRPPLHNVCVWVCDRNRQNVRPVCAMRTTRPLHLINDVRMPPRTAG